MSYGVEDARIFCEMRLLLTLATENGIVDTCRVLLENVKVAPDGIRASSNRTEWLRAQRDCDEKNSTMGNTPLLQAAQSGQASRHVREGRERRVPARKIKRRKNAIYAAQS
mmetsp:Transcript_22733/g.56486  ORF Transcript_22733/g.56486 Transcript_22733/m.56486 type:complete len:111 (+) Transcript_22733:441-773(+)